MKKLFLLLALLCPSIALAQSTAQQTQPGYLSSVGCPGSQKTCFIPYSSANPLPVSASASAITGVLPTVNGGTGLSTIGSANQCLQVNGSGNALTYGACSGSGVVTSFSAGTTGLLPSTATTGAVTLTGTLAVANGGTGSSTGDLSALSATASGASSAQTLAAHFADNYNVSDWGSSTTCNGASDDTAAFNAAGVYVSSLYANTNKVGIIHYHGNCQVCGMTVYRNTLLQNDGGQIKVAASCSTSPPIASENWSTNTGSGHVCGTLHPEVPSWFGFKDAKIDCNSGNASYSGVCTALYGPSEIMAGTNVWTGGKSGNYALQTEDANTGNSTAGNLSCQEEGYFDNMDFRFNAGGGWLDRGPHNSTINRIIGGFNGDYSWNVQGSYGVYDGSFDYIGSVHSYAANSTSHYVNMNGVGGTIGSVDSDAGTFVIGSTSTSVSIGTFLLNNCGEYYNVPCFQVDGNHVSVGTIIGAVNASSASTTAILWNGSNGKIGSAQIDGSGFSGTAGSGNIGLRITGQDDAFTNLEMTTFNGTSNIAIKNEGAVNTISGTLGNNTTSFADSGNGFNNVNMTITEFTNSGQIGVSGSPQATDNWTINEFGYLASVSLGAVNSGNNTAAAFIPTGSTVPANGTYLPVTNTVGIAAGGIEDVAISSTSPQLNVVSAGAVKASVNINSYGGSNGAEIDFLNNNAAAYNTGVGSSGNIFQYDLGTSHFISNVSSGNVTLGEGTNQLVLPSGGNVAIGTTASSTALTVNGTVTATALATTNGVALTNLAQIATNAVLGNATSGTANVTALSIGGCSSASSALIWTTNTGFGCNTSITANAVPAANLTGTTLASGVTTASLTTISGLTTNGFVKTSGSTGALSVDTNTYLTGNQSITLSGDASGTGSTAITTTLATVNSNTGSFGSSTAIPSFTVNGKGLVTAASTNAVIAPAGTLSGSTLSSGVTGSSLTSVGTLASLAVTGKVSLGTTNPLVSTTSGLTIQNAFSTSYSATAPAGTNAFYLYNTDTTANDATTIYIRNDTSGSTSACALSMLPTASGSGSLRFNCRTGGTFADTMTIGNNQVSVGTTSTSGSMLNVNGSVSIGTSYVGTAAPTNGMIVQGAVGIGTPAPAEPLDTVVASNQHVGFFQSASLPAIGAFNDAFGGWLALNVNPGGNVYLSSTAGKVGVGTTSPKSELDVYGNVAIGTSYAGVTAAPTNGAIIQGNVSIGTTANSYPLQVAGVASTAGQAGTGAPAVGNAVNLTGKYLSTTTASWAADEITVETALGGTAYKLNGFAQTLNLATSGAGGMDTGSAPASGWIYIYAIYNPATATQSILATITCTSCSPQVEGNVYTGANLPSGYTASALIGAVYLNASNHFVLFGQTDKTVSFVQQTSVNGVAQASATQVTASAILPPNAKSWGGNIAVVGSALGTTGGVAGDASGTGGTYINNVSATYATWGVVSKSPIYTTQSYWYQSGSASNTFYVFISSYTF